MDERLELDIDKKLAFQAVMRWLAVATGKYDNPHGGRIPADTLVQACLFTAIRNDG